MYHNLFNHLPIEGHLGCFQVWAIANKAVTHIFLSGRGQVASVVSDSVRPHRWQPTRLCHPWDSPGKNTGVDCHFLLLFFGVGSGKALQYSCLEIPMDKGAWPLTVHGV